MKGWKLVSLYVEPYPTDPKHPIYVSFAHYTGRQRDGGGLEYDKALRGNLSLEELRCGLRKHLILGSGNIEERSRG